jgi:hypothetical protein
MKHAQLISVWMGLWLAACSACLAGGVPCAGTSPVWADPEFPCAGDTIGIYVIVRDCYGTPLVGVEVNFYSDRGGDDTIIGSPTITNVEGFAGARMTSVVPGECHAFVICMGVTLGPSGVVSWGGASAAEHTTWGNIKSLYR